MSVVWCFIDAAARAYLVDAERQLVRCVTSPRERWRDEEWEPFEEVFAFDRSSFEDSREDGWDKHEAAAAARREWKPGQPLNQGESLEFIAGRRFYALTEPITDMFTLRGPALDVVAGPGVPLLVLTEDEIHVVDASGRTCQVLPDAEEDDVDVGPWPVEWPLAVGREPFGDSQPVLFMYELAARTTPRRVLLSSSEETRPGSFFIPVVGDRQPADTAALAYLLTIHPDRPLHLWRYALDGSGPREAFVQGVDAIALDVRARRAYVHERAAEPRMTSLGRPVAIIELSSWADAVSRLDELVSAAVGLSPAELVRWGEGLR